MKRKGLILCATALIIAALSFGIVSAYEGIIYKYSPISEYEKIEKTKDGLEKHKKLIKEKNQKIKDARLNGIIATITFDRPISITELKAYAAKYDIEPVQIQARALQTNGTRVTTMSKTTKGFMETDALIQQQVKESSLTFVGYIGMYALVDSEQITNIENDNITYLIDTSADAFYANKKDKDGRQRNKIEGLSDKLSKRFPHSLAWDLEDIRAEN